MKITNTEQIRRKFPKAHPNSAEFCISSIEFLSELRLHILQMDGSLSSVPSHPPALRSRRPISSLINKTPMAYKDLKITRLELLMVKPRFMFLKMHTNQDLVGYGEPILEGQTHAVAGAVRAMENYLLGKDPRQIEHHWQALYKGSFYRGGPILTSALSGIEQAMWDILGKSLGVPVYQLLGGSVRERIRIYAHAHGADKEQLCKRARELVDMGFNFLKTGFEAPVAFVENQRFLRNCVERFAALREEVGPEVDLALDFHGRFSPTMSKRLIKELETLYPYFVEEPCLPGNTAALVELKNSTTVPLATGERIFTKWGFRDLIEQRAVDILQPDLCHAGGIMEVKKISAMAEASDLAVAPHNPLGPISLAACLQLDACTLNAVAQEQVTLGDGYLVKPFEMQNGYIDLPTEPGLGIELDEEKVRALEYDGNWETPRVIDQRDGSVAEW